MKILKDNEEIEAFKFLDICEEEARKSKCLKSKCGSIVTLIHSSGKQSIIGKGFNQPSGNSTPRCLIDKKELSSSFKSDRSCCSHAEGFSLIDALRSGALPIIPLQDVIRRIYFVRLDENNNKKVSGKPYCTICSKMALACTIDEFVLWHKEGITIYSTLEYNELSFNYGK